MKTSLTLLLTSFSAEADAIAVIRSLVEEHWVACGTILPKATSIYCWQGKLNEVQEFMVLLKTSHHLIEACMKRLKELHPYSVPEIMSIEPTSVDSNYAQWVKDVLCATMLP
ncbi:MAG: divalent-cation tolerance protein CutA [Verrucomicrobiae bacterium]|jgi:periplasmic divalent cation tolerance protein|nr:divalent-cation tolerance protein CutA [Verrucomicrobiae bacterium]